MFCGETVLAIITARGGSKRLPEKNLRRLGGKPLIAWTIEAAGNSRFVDRLVLSSDDGRIIETARSLGCDVPFRRPAHLSGDRASSVDTAMHALEALETSYDWLVLLQPTSPLRRWEDIDGCLEKARAASASSCVGVSEPWTSPFLAFRIGSYERLDPLLPMDLRHVRSQDLPPTYEINGALYAARVPWFREHQTFIDENTVGYVMPQERSVNIDTQIDFALAEVLSMTEPARKEADA